MSTVRGNEGSFLSLQVGAGPAHVSTDHKSAGIAGDDKDDVTFQEVKDGEITDATLSLTSIIRTATGGLWRFLWDNAGKEATVIFGPHGNEEASTNLPHFTGIIRIPRKPPISHEAQTSAERPEFEYEAPFIGSVELDDGA